MGEENLDKHQKGDSNLQAFQLPPVFPCSNSVLKTQSKDIHLSSRSSHS
jgi:hypothetical protein